MRTALNIMICLTAISLSASPAHAQGETALPFLLITPSIDGNGMGGIGTSVASDNATATIQNPAQLGLFGLRGLLNASIYTPRADWLPEFNLSGLTYDVWAVNGAVPVHKFVDLPFGLAVGAGYSRTNLDLGRFAVTTLTGPAVIGYFDAWERSSNVTVGIGLDCVVKLSAGMTFKSVESHLSPVGTESEQTGGSANVSARDYGIMALLPLPELVEEAGAGSCELAQQLKPLLDVGFGYAQCNRGGAVVYADAAQSDPLPRKAALGLSVEAGVVYSGFDPAWKPVSYMLVHEAEDILVKRANNGVWSYQEGLGDIGFMDHVIAGKTSPDVWVRKGWQVQAGEMVYIRGGSVHAPGLNYETSGYTLRLGGIFKVIMLLSPEAREAGWFRFLASVLDLQYTSAHYSGTSSPIRDTAFKGINIVVRSIPFLD
jgi:hypothetical protein